MTPAVSASVIDATSADQLLAEFRRAATQVPAYQVLLDEHGVRAADVRDVQTFSRVCPLLSKANTFDRFPLPQLSVGGRLHDVAEVLTSSGHGGRFSFGVISRAEAASSAAFVDAALDAAFSVKSKKTLAINCLPMGVVVSSRCMTVATTSVREDMAVALVKTFGDGYDQIVLIGDPLFMKRLTDHAIEQGLDWRRYRVNAVIGEETFGEHFRSYLGSRLGLDPDRPDGGHIMSSFGVGELGLHLCFETPATATLVRAARANPALARDLLGWQPRVPGSWQPMILAFDPAADLHRGRGPGPRMATARWRSPCSIRPGRCRCSAIRPATWLVCSIAIGWRPRCATTASPSTRLRHALSGPARAGRGKRCRTGRRSASTRTRCTRIRNWLAISPAPLA